MAKTSIRNMMFYGFHGTYEYEREQGQKFFIDIEVEYDEEKAVASDDVKDAADTAAIYSLVKSETENRRFQLLVSLSAHIGDRLLEKYPHFLSVTTRIRKPSVPISGPLDFVEVEATRRRA